MNISIIASIFWGSFFGVFYTFIGYGILVWCFNKMKTKKLFKVVDKTNLPTVTLVIPAYNEERWIIDKIQNSVQLEYPSDKIHFLIVSDGSTDRTKELVDQFIVPPRISLRHFHQPERRGKIAAVERIMPNIETPITIFTDANTMLNARAILHLVQHFQDVSVGVVAGEKRIAKSVDESVAAMGEGVYWKYESILKNLDYQFYSTIGAAGELFAIRTALYQPIPKDSIIEDFYLTMSIAVRGYRIAYAPHAYALEGGSASVKEELKRKIRIAAGCFQTITRLLELCNPFKHGRLSFQFISRRIFRWIVVPILLPILFCSNFTLVWRGNSWYQIFFAFQVLFYLFAGFGYLLEQRQIRNKILFIPYYFCVMHYAFYRGFLRFLKGNQSVLWERAERA